MEDLALFALVTLGLEIVVSLVVLYFSATYRFRGTFRRTAMATTGLLAVIAGWLMGANWVLGLPATVAVIVSILFMYLPGRSKK